MRLEIFHTKYSKELSMVGIFEKGRGLVDIIYVNRFENSMLYEFINLPEGTSSFYEICD